MKLSEIEKPNKRKEDENKVFIFSLLGLIQIKCTNLHRIIEDGSINIPQIRGVIPTLMAILKLIFQIIFALINVILTLVLFLVSIFYAAIKGAVVLSLVIVFGIVTILFAFIGVNIKAGMLNSLIGRRKD